MFLFYLLHHCDISLNARSSSDSKECVFTEKSYSGLSNFLLLFLDALISLLAQKV